MTRDLTNARWRKSSRSQQQGACVEIGPAHAVVGVRDTKAPERGHLAVPSQVFHAFIAAVKTSRL